MPCSPNDLKRLSEVAKKEIGEADVNIEDALIQLRELIAAKYGDLRLPPDVDQLLLERSLRYRKCDTEKAANHVHLFFKLLSDLHAMHKDNLFLPSAVRDYFYDSMGMCPLKSRDSKGRAVILFNFELLPAATFSLDKFLTGLMTLMERMTRLSVDTQRLGIVIVSYFKGYELGHATQFTLTRFAVVSKLFRGSFPVRYKALHMVACPRLFTYTWEVAKPFLGAKLRSRFHLHSDDLTNFHEQLSPDILPEFLGGKLSHEDSLDLNFMRELVRNEEYYEELMKYGYMTNPTPES